MMCEPLHEKQKDWDLETGEDCSYCVTCDAPWPCPTVELADLKARCDKLIESMRTEPYWPSEPYSEKTWLKARLVVWYWLKLADMEEV